MGSTTLNFSIGQGENTQTVIGMTRFYQGLANGGVEVRPYIVRPSTAESRSYGLSEQQALDIRRSLIEVVSRGTAARSRQDEFVFAGKTGTAQNSGGLDHGWFLGFAPADLTERSVRREMLPIAAPAAAGGTSGSSLGRSFDRAFEPAASYCLAWTKR